MRLKVCCGVSQTDAPGDVDRLTEEGYMRWSSQTQRKKYSQGLPGEAYKAFREKIWVRCDLPYALVGCVR